jgi:hypothetical protein
MPAVGEGGPFDVPPCEVQKLWYPPLSHDIVAVGERDEVRSQIMEYLPGHDYAPSAGAGSNRIVGTLRGGWSSECCRNGVALPVVA